MESQKRTHCGHCGKAEWKESKIVSKNMGGLLKPKLWKSRVDECSCCGKIIETVLMVNGKTGKDGEKLNEIERHYLGAVNMILPDKP